MQKKWLLLLTLLITMILTASTVVFAWFTLVEKTQPILIYSGSIKLKANLYLVKEDNSREEITESFTFNNVVPGQSFTFELVVKNEGSLNGDLEVDFTFKSNKSNHLNYFKIIHNTDEALFSEAYSIDDLLNKRSNKTITFNIVILNTLKNNMIDFNDYVSIDNILLTLTQSEVV